MVFRRYALSCNTMKALLLAFCLLSFTGGPGSSDFDRAFADPPMEYRPFVRWWWNGDRVDGKELSRELRLLKEAGIGGVEISPIAPAYIQRG